MGALGPVSPWIPEDDVLLKNSIEVKIFFSSSVLFHQFFVN
jgi:hypothetical protein